ncbi:hypothetical protein BN1708_007171 [Verticillium longisporum]|uniref:Uncharacterized protein n=1 Tax=Verticillium longisporum TaxID=100787 RepID=A0A0G4MR83_VERLO|nr:hypothetical protein BN1708_007171 [Verticillium longisporum]
MGYMSLQLINATFQLSLVALGFLKGSPDGSLLVILRPELALRLCSEFPSEVDDEMEGHEATSSSWSRAIA